MQNNPSICFVAHNAFGAMVGENKKHIGGIERQQALMSKWLAANTDFKVSMITWDEGQDDEIEISGIKIYKMCSKESGIRGLRFFYPRWSSLMLAFKRANADIYYYNCGDLGLGQVVLWAHWNKKKVIYSVAHEIDCIPPFPALKQY